MLTTLQELREDILSSVLLSTQTKTIVCAFIDNHLEKEINQMSDAYDKSKFVPETYTFEDYYNETYDNKGQA